MVSKIIRLTKLVFLFVILGLLTSCSYKNTLVAPKRETIVPHKRIFNLESQKEVYSKKRGENWWSSDKEMIALKSFFDPRSTSGSKREIDPVSRELVIKSVEAIAKEDWPIAQASMERAIRLNPMDEYLWTQLAFVCSRRGDSAQAIIFAKKAMALSTENPSLQIEIRIFINEISLKKDVQ